MEIKALKPRRGEGALRIDDSDDLVVIENFEPLPKNGALPESGVYIENHGVIIICTEGMAQFEYEGQVVQLRKNDMFNVPISGWWGGSHSIKKQKLALEDAQEQLQDNGQKLIIRMNNAWSSVETSHKKLRVAHDAIEQAEENLRLNKDYYRVGTTKMSDLLLAQEQYQQARDRYTDAYADFQTKQLEYRQATGQK